MKLTVVFARYPPDTPKAGFLSAYVVQENATRGRNLLAGRYITGLPGAREAVKREIRWMIPGAEIEFDGPEGEASGK